MSDKHPTTAALLLAARNARGWAPADAPTEPHLDGAFCDMMAAHRRWCDAGCPDAPEPCFVPTEPGFFWRSDDPNPITVVREAGAQSLRLKRFRNADTVTFYIVEDVTDDGLWLGPVAPWAPPSEADTLPAAGGTGWTTVGPWTDDGGGRWVRIGYVGTTRGHAARAHADSWRFMPRKGGEALGDASSLADAKKKADQHLLPGFVWDTIYATAHPDPGPCPPAELPEWAADVARKQPKKWDTWRRRDGSTFFLVEPIPGDGLWWAYSDGTSGPLEGTSGMTFLGNRPADAPAPKPRTAEEARANPMPGDRWRNHLGAYTVLSCAPSDSSSKRHHHRAPRAQSCGEPDTYLGHFPPETS